MITTDFEKLSFHDSSIERIDRTDDSIEIEFKGAFLSKDHPNSGGCDWWIDEGILKLLNVTGEESKFWYNDKEGKPHPKPEFPIDEIMNLDIEGEYFKFGGFLEREPWVEWYVKSSKFEVEIVTKHKIHS